MCVCACEYSIYVNQRWNFEHSWRWTFLSFIYSMVRYHKEKTRSVFFVTKIIRISTSIWGDSMYKWRSILLWRTLMYAYRFVLLSFLMLSKVFIYTRIRIRTHIYLSTHHYLIYRNAKLKRKESSRFACKDRENKNTILF